MEYIEINRRRKGNHVKQQVKCPVCGLRCYYDTKNGFKRVCGHIVSMERQGNGRVINALFSNFKNETKEIEKLAEVILEVRQYLCNTEFAPEPFTEPVDINMLKVIFPLQIIGVLKELGYCKRDSN